MAKGFCESKLKILPKIVLKDEVFVKNLPIVYIHPAKTGGGNLVYLAKALSKGFNIKLLQSNPQCKNYFKNGIAK